MQAVRRWALQKIWALHDHIDGSKKPKVEWLEVLDKEEEPLANGPLRPPPWQLPPGNNPINWVPDPSTPCSEAACPA